VQLRPFTSQILGEIKRKYDVVGPKARLVKHEPKAGACHPGFEPGARSISMYTVYGNEEKSFSVQKKMVWFSHEPHHTPIF
jgi:hypothetical protein